MLFRNKNTSVDVAKDRLQHLLSSDRITCQSDHIPHIEKELIAVLSKYIDVSIANFDVQMTRSEIRIKY